MVKLISVWDADTIHLLYFHKCVPEKQIIGYDIIKTINSYFSNVLNGGKLCSKLKIKVQPSLTQTAAANCRFTRALTALSILATATNCNVYIKKPGLNPSALFYRGLHRLTIIIAECYQLSGSKLVQQPPSAALRISPLVGGGERQQFLKNWYGTSRRLWK